MHIYLLIHLIAAAPAQKVQPRAASATLLNRTPTLGYLVDPDGLRAIDGMPQSARRSADTALASPTGRLLIAPGHTRALALGDGPATVIQLAEARMDGFAIGHAMDSVLFSPSGDAAIVLSKDGDFTVIQLATRAILRAGRLDGQPLAISDSGEVQAGVGNAIAAAFVPNSPDAILLESDAIVFVKESRRVAYDSAVRPLAMAALPHDPVLLLAFEDRVDWVNYASGESGTIAIPGSVDRLERLQDPNAFLLSNTPFDPAWMAAWQPGGLQLHFVPAEQRQ